MALEKRRGGIDPVAPVPNEADIDDGEVGRRAGRDRQSGPQRGRDPAHRVSEFAEHTLEMKADQRLILHDEHPQRTRA